MLSEWLLTWWQIIRDDVGGDISREHHFKTWQWIVSEGPIVNCLVFLFQRLDLWKKQLTWLLWLSSKNLSTKIKLFVWYSNNSKYFEKYPRKLQSGEDGRQKNQADWWADCLLGNFFVHQSNFGKSQFGRLTNSMLVFFRPNNINLEFVVV